MVGNIDKNIMKGINNCKVVIICLTEKYINKINDAVIYNKPNDNCFKEWNYALFKNKRIIPIFMEEKMVNLFNSNDGGLLNMYLNSLLYINITDDDYVNNDFNLLCKTLQKNKIYTKNQKKILKIKTGNSYDNLIKYLSNVLQNTSNNNDKKNIKELTEINKFKVLKNNPKHNSKNKNKNKNKNRGFIKI